MYVVHVLYWLRHINKAIKRTTVVIVTTIYIM